MHASLLGARTRDALGACAAAQALGQMEMDLEKINASAQQVPGESPEPVKAAAWPNEAARAKALDKGRGPTAASDTADASRPAAARLDENTSASERSDSKTKTEHRSEMPRRT